MKEIHRSLVMIPAAIAFAAAISFTTSLPLLAKETTGEKMQNAAEDAGNDMKQEGRKARKKMRDHSGHGDAGKDTKDALRNAGDEIETGARKAKRKVD